MLIATLPMPHVTGSYVDRRHLMSIDELLRSVGPVNHFGNFQSPKIIIGSYIGIPPKHLYKVFHVGRDNDWLFETVCAIEGSEHYCLYTKMIRHYVDIAVSMKAIERYRVNTGSIVPLVDIISQNYWRQNPLFSENIIHSIVPPIFSKLDLDRATMQLVDLMEEDSDHRPGSVYRPLYDNEPALLEGLISGRFITPPHYGVMVNHPDIRIIPDRWFYVDKVKHQNYISSGYTHINHPYFDAIALSLVGMRPSSLSIMTTLSSAIDGLMDLSVTRYFKDPYTQFHPLSSTYMSSVREVISKLLAESVMIYCQIYDIDYSCFMEEKTVQSSICIEKNIYDEVSISIHDLVNDRYTCFYSYIPPLILATMGVGMYLDER